MHKALYLWVVLFCLPSRQLLLGGFKHVVVVGVYFSSNRFNTALAIALQAVYRVVECVLYPLLRSGFPQKVQPSIVLRNGGKVVGNFVCVPIVVLHVHRVSPCILKAMVTLHLLRLRRRLR